MNIKVASWLLPPIFEDEERTRTARWLHFITLTCIIALFFSFATRIFSNNPAPSRFPISIVLFVLLIGVLVAIRQGWVKPISYVLWISLWLAITAATINQGGVRSPTFSAYVVVMLIAGFLTGLRTGIFVVLLSLVAGLGMVYGENNIASFPEYTPYSSAYIWRQELMFGMVLLGLIWLFLSDLQKTIQYLKATRTESQQSAEAYRALVDNLPDGITRFDRQFRRLYVSTAVRNITGRNEEDYLGKTNRELGLPEDTIMFWDRIFTKVFETKEPQITQIDYVGTEGERHYEVRIAPEFQPDGSVNTILTITRDVTEWNIMVDALNTSEELYRLISENSSDLIILRDRSLKTVYISPSVLEMTGYSVEEYNALDPYEYIHPDDVERVRGAKITEQVLAGIIPPPAEFRFRHKNGHYIWLEIITRPIMEDGEIKRFVSSARDVTARAEQREERIRLVERLRLLHTIDRTIIQSRSIEETLKTILIPLKQIVACYHISFLLFDDETAHAYAQDNGEIMTLSFPRQELTPFTESLLANKQHTVTNLNEVTNPNPLEEHWRNENIQSYTSLPLFFDEQLIGSLNLCNDQQIPFSRQQYDIANEVAVQLSIAIRQKQMRNQLEGYTAELEKRVSERTQQLEDTNKELEAFSYSVSHDLRAPLRAINGFSESLHRKYGDDLPDQAKHYLQRIANNAEQMGQLIDDLLRLSRLGRTPISMEGVELHTIAHKIVDNLRGNNQLSDANIIIHDMPPAQADDSLLEIVYTNLIGNSLKYSKPDTIPQIEIGAMQRDDDVIYYVKDNGLGFDMAYVDKLFQVFQRLHTDHEGTGIGLAIVNRIIRRHNGEVWAEGKVNEGATIYFTLGSQA